MNYFPKIKKNGFPSIKSIIGSIGIVAALTACSVSTPEGPQPVFQNTDDTKNLFSLDLLEGDTIAALEAEYDAEVLVWKPEAGFAILGSALESDLLPQSLELDSNQGTIQMPVTALSSGWMSGLKGWALSGSGWTLGGSSFASGDHGFALGGNGFVNGGSGWKTGVNSAYLEQNEAYWEQIDLFAAHYSSAKLGQGIKIAVIDTGIDLKHPMFTDSLAPASEWRDYVDYDQTPQEQNGGLGSGHGTAVSGIILQVAPQATILPIRVLDKDGIGDMDHVIYAIDHAVQSGADIINLSLGSDSNSWTLQRMMLYAKSQGVFTIAAAGNTGEDDSLLFPAKMSSWPKHKGALYAVGSVDQHDAVSEFSTARSHNIIFAPGEQIRTAFPNHRLANVSGTSFAAPLFAGSLALAMSELNTTEKQDMMSYILSGLERERVYSKFYTSGNKWRHGNGILNSNALVNATKLENLSFETSGLLNGWNSSNSQTTQDFNNSAYTRNGSQIAEVSSAGYLSKEIRDLKPNTTYEVKMLVAFDNGQGLGRLRLSNFDTSGNSENKYYGAYGKAYQLKYISKSFTTGEENTSVTVEIKNRSGVGKMYVDEVKLKALSVVVN